MSYLQACITEKIKSNIVTINGIKLKDQTWVWIDLRVASENSFIFLSIFKMNKKLN